MRLVTHSLDKLWAYRALRLAHKLATMLKIFEHDTSLIEKFRLDTLALSGRDIKIQEGGWLTSNFNVISSHVKGRSFAISAGSVVTKNALPNCINGRVLEKEI